MHNKKAFLTIVTNVSEREGRWMCHECHVSQVSLRILKNGGRFLLIVIYKYYLYITMDVSAPDFA